MRKQAKMIGRSADMEKRITANADKAHAKTGSNIAKLGDQLDRIDDEMGDLNKKVGHVYDVVEKRYGG